MPHDPLSWIDDELSLLEDRHLRRQLAVRTGAQRAVVVVGDRELINFGSNDYLGLAADERLIAAVSTAIKGIGWGSGASPLVTGRGQLHARLEVELAGFEGTAAALLFPSGFAANMGSIAALANSGDVIYSDAKNHASIIDGCRLSHADVVVYPHGDVGALRSMLQDGGRYRRRLIVTDSLFSMDGDFAPLADLAELAESFCAMLMVDEAHATGVFGQHGRGVCELAGVEDRVHVRIGTLSKGLGSIGGFAVGSQSLVDWLANRARSFVFSTASPEAMAAAGLAALQIVRDEPERRAALLERATAVRQALQDRGWSTGKSESQIIPVILGDAASTMEMAARLHDTGLLVPGIRPPTVPDGESMLRVSLSYCHTDEMIDRLLDSL